MSSLIIKRCCCICDSYPTSIVINVAAYTSGGISFAAFTQTLYKCCIQTQQYPQYWGLKTCCVYKMNAVVCGFTTNLDYNRDVYFTMIIKFGNPPYPTYYDRLTFTISTGFLGAGNNPVIPCVPRSDSTSQTACYGITSYRCSQYTYDLQGFRDSYFENNLSSCGCSWNGYNYLETYRYVGNCGQVAGTYILDYITPDLTVTIS